jgi:hypothetical protein
MFKQIPGFPGYEITRCGMVWSKPRVGSYQIRGRKGGWLKAQKHKEYLRVGLCVKGKRYHRYVHRLVLEAFVGPCPEGLECRHLNGVGTNNHLGNLKWGTQQENRQDTVRHRVVRE